MTHNHQRWHLSIVFDDNDKVSIKILIIDNAIVNDWIIIIKKIVVAMSYPFLGKATVENIVMIHKLKNWSNCYES